MATTVSDRLRAAMSDHDIDAFVGCFTPDYRSEQPAHPDRAFSGRDQVRTNWSAIFREIPDVQERSSAPSHQIRGRGVGRVDDLRDAP